MGFRFGKLSGWAAPAASGMLFVALLLAGFRYALTQDLWDDALFFWRFGYNIVHHGVAAWNPADGPVHGNTSQLFQFVSAGMVAAVPGGYHVAIKGFLAGCLGMTALALGVVSVDGQRPDVGVLLLGLVAPPTVLLMSSGMETLFAMAVLAGFYLVLSRRPHGDLTPTYLVGLAAAQLGVYLVRPDMALLSFGAVAGTFAAERRWRDGLLAVGTGLAVVALGLVALKAYYGTAVPLSAILKNRLFSTYSVDYQSLGAAGERRQLLLWLAMTGPFWWVAWMAQPAPEPRLVRWAWLAPAALFVAYHATTTVGIMGYHARFYQPATVAVVIAAAHAWARFRRGPRWVRLLPMFLYPTGLGALVYAKAIELPRVDYYLSWVEPGLYLGYGVAVVLALGAALAPRWPGALLGLLAMLTSVVALPRGAPKVTDEAAVLSIQRHMRATRGIRWVQKCLPAPLHLYHSELGVPGAMFPESRVTDLSGLMNPELVLEDISFDELCMPDPPDVLFLPHWSHKVLNDEIQASKCLRQFRRPAGFQGEKDSLWLRLDHVARFDACHAKARGRP